jgi:hypothetical protein
LGGDRPTITVCQSLGGVWHIDPSTGYRGSEGGLAVKDVIKEIAGDKNTVLEKKTKLPFPFLIVSDDGEGVWKDEYARFLYVLNEATTIASGVFHVPPPVVGVLVTSKKEAVAGSMNVGFNRCISFNPERMREGGPYRFVAVLLHEFCHDKQAYHGDDFSQANIDLLGKAGMDYCALLESVVESWGRHFGGM